MAEHHIDRTLKKYLQHIFCSVSSNSPYQLHDFVHVLLDAIEHVDFTNNTCVRIGGPTGETVFNRLKDTDAASITDSFHIVMRKMLILLRCFLRNRRVALAFDTTDEPYYGHVAGLWIHPYRPVQGSTGCFKFITITAVDKDIKLILGSLPVRVGAEIASLVTELLRRAQQYVRAEIVLFDRGFDDYRLIEALQNMGVRYQILWRKSKWTTVKFSTMKRNEIREVNRTGTYSRDKTKFKVRLRFVLIKQYRRYRGGKSFNWVFATNTRQKSQHYYVDKYRKRWGIETAFRVLDNIQIKTTTKNEVIRYFINMFCCLVYNLWKIAGVVDDNTHSLKNFVATACEAVRVMMAPHEPPPSG